MLPLSGQNLSTKRILVHCSLKFPRLAKYMDRQVPNFHSIFGWDTVAFPPVQTLGTYLPVHIDLPPWENYKMLITSLTTSATFLLWCRLNLNSWDQREASKLPNVGAAVKLTIVTRRLSSGMIHAELSDESFDSFSCISDSFRVLCFRSVCARSSVHDRVLLRMMITPVL